VDRDGYDLLTEDEVKPPLNSDHGRKLKRKAIFPKIKLSRLSEKLTIHGYDLLLTCNTAPEQYDVFKQKKLIRYMENACARF